MAETASGASSPALLLSSPASPTTPTSPWTPGRRGQGKKLSDDRQAVKPKPKCKLQPLQLRPRAAPKADATPVQTTQEDRPGQTTQVGCECMRSLASAAGRLCTFGAVTSMMDKFQRLGSLQPLSLVVKLRGDKDEKEEAEPPRRWYRVHPLSDELFFVRPDPGVAGRAPGHPDAGTVHIDSVMDTPANKDREDSSGTNPVQSMLKKKNTRMNSSVPSCLDRMEGIEESFDDTFVNFCKLCYTEHADVVLLPCRHGGMCEACLRKSLFIRPVHKGGNSCPWCRKSITEVIKLYDEGAIKMYGYAISAGCFFDRKR